MAPNAVAAGFKFHRHVLTRCSTKAHKMPRFVFRVGPDIMFAGTLACRQCRATCLDGSRCKRTSCKMLPYCAQHTKTLLGIRVAPSDIEGAGLGLFALQEFPKGSLLAPLAGELIDTAELDRRYGRHTGPYAIIVGENTWDAALQRTVGNFANTRIWKGRSVKKGTNAEIVANLNDNARPWIEATRRIKAGDEILAWYGADYRVEPDVQISTR